jgi:hypothetical protein
LVSPITALFDEVYDGTRMPPWKLSIDAVLTILPPRPCLIICLATAWLRKNSVRRLMFITSSQSFSVNSVIGARRMMPALLNRISTPPSPSTVFLTMSSTHSFLLKSAVIAMHRRPSFSMAAFESDISRTSTRATSAPASASPTAIPCPSPREPPVTIAFFPFSLNLSSIMTVSP